MNHLLFDTETTDLVANSLRSDRLQPEIVEFYGVIINDDNLEIAELDFLCKPSQPMTAENIAIHHITNEMVKDCPPFAYYAEMVDALFEQSNNYVAHNLAFDLDVVDVEFKRLKKKSVRLYRKRHTCLVEKTEHIKGYRLRLGMLHEYLFGTSFPDAHRAKSDVNAMRRCFVKLMSDGEI